MQTVYTIRNPYTHHCQGRFTTLLEAHFEKQGQLEKGEISSEFEIWAIEGESTRRLNAEELKGLITALVEKRRELLNGKRYDEVPYPLEKLTLAHWKTYTIPR